MPKISKFPDIIPSSSSVDPIPMPKHLLFLLAFFFSFTCTYCNQLYDKTPCASGGLSLGSAYKCVNTSVSSCDAYVAYRSKTGLDTVSNIANLFGVNVDRLLRLNNLTNPLQVLKIGREVLLPIRCSCSGSFFLSEVSYVTHSATTLARIACETFEGLAKLPTLLNVNSNGYNSSIIKAGSKLNVPITCPCPDSRDRFRFLVSYPLEEFDETGVLAKKFNTTVNDIWLQNGLSPAQTIYPNTLILIPLRSVPALEWNVSGSSDDRTSFIPISTYTTTKKNGSRWYKYVIGVMAGILVIFIALFVLVVYRKSSHKWRHEKQPSSGASHLSALVVAGMSKYSPRSYVIEELSKATMGFSEGTRLGSRIHKGSIYGSEVIVKKMTYFDARRIISIHSKINHFNIAKLDGVCYGSDESFPSYLVFKFAENGCLRDCLQDPKKDIPWHTRTRIAFDIAVGLHYIHHCTLPAFVHRNISSENILITFDWRAKIANLGAVSAVDSEPVSTRVDVFGFGGVLFALLSAKDASEWSFMKENSSYLDGFDQIQRILDPRLKDYTTAEAVCLSVLAKACLEEDPMCRPSMNDILKILARMVRM